MAAFLSSVWEWVALVENVARWGVYDADAQAQCGLDARASPDYPVVMEIIDDNFDINRSLIKNPTATFFVRVAGDSMKDAGIFDSDLLVVDRSAEVRNGAIVVAALDGELVVKYLRLVGEKMFLVPGNPEYSPVEVHDRDLHIWGVVVWSIHPV